MPISQKIENYLANSSWIRKMFEEGEKLRAVFGADKVYDFTIGNPYMEPTAKCQETLLRLVQNPEPGMHGYMSNAGYPTTRQAIAEVLQKETGLPFDINNIMMSVGAGGALNAALKTFLDPGDQVIVFKPFFVEYRFYADNHNGQTVELATDANFKPIPELLAQAITPKTRLVLINTPNNPTGVVYSAEDLEMINRICLEKGQEFGTTIYVLSDEPYKKIAYDGLKVPSVFKHIKNVIVATSHSKDLALPGERIGYLAVSPNCEDAQKIMDGLIFCNRTLGYVNAPALMQRLVAELQEESIDLQMYQDNRDLLYNHLISLGFEVNKPQGAFYFFPKSPLEDEVEFVNIAKKYNILLVPGRGFGLPGYFRISYCINPEVIKNSLPAFAQLAQEMGLKA